MSHNLDVAQMTAPVKSPFKGVELVFIQQQPHRFRSHHGSRKPDFSPVPVEGSSLEMRLMLMPLVADVQMCDPFFCVSNLLNKCL